MPAPLLSVLIPAYRYAEGVARILERLAPWSTEECEVRVYDDSPDDAVEQAVGAFGASNGLIVHYHRNRPALGAVANWNALLTSAKGRHVLLLHHDEFPLGQQFLARVLTALSHEPAPDVLILDCLLVDARNGHNRRHMPGLLRLAVARHAPDFLYRRNVIGPVSALVVRRSLYPAFESTLRWMVDVDAYVRLLHNPGLRIVLEPALRVGSLLAREGSITSTLQPELERVHHDELTWLRRERDSGIPWIADPRNGSWPDRLLLSTESLMWLLWRAVARIGWWLGLSTLPPAQLRRDLQAGRTR